MLDMLKLNFCVFLLLATSIICMTTESNGFEDVMKHFKSQLKLSQPEVTTVGNLLPYPSIQRDFTISDVQVPRNGSDSCISDLKYVLTHLKTKWAEKMIDANGKFPSGILRGNNLWMGDFQECSDVEADASLNESSHKFRGGYCVLQWNIDLPTESMQLPLESTICVPDSCNSTVIQSNILALLHYLDHLPFMKNYSSVLSLQSVTCKENSHQTLDILAVGFLSLLGFFSILIILGSGISVYVYFFPKSTTKNIQEFPYLYRQQSASSTSERKPMLGETDYLIDDDNEQIFHDGRSNCESMSQRFLSALKICSGYLSGVKNFLLCFCIFTNGQDILTTKVSQDQLLCIHGIRVLSLIWIILAHTYDHCLYVVQNVGDFVEDMDDFAFQVILHGEFSVDSFFLLGGFLLTCLFLKKVEKRSSRINWLYLIIHRFWRLTPVYAVIIFYIAALFKYTGSGGFWDDQYQSCRKYWWWWNLLYINNFLSVNSMCAPHTWYLANDMQFYIVVTCLLYVICRWPKVGLSSVAVLLVSSWIVTLYICHHNSIIPIFVDSHNTKNGTEYAQRINHYMDLVYNKPYCRIGPYLIGVFLAYIYYKSEEKRPFLPWWQQMCGWIIAIFCSLTAIYGLYHVKTGNQILFDFYNTFSRSSFSLGVAWVIYACLTGHAVIINQILSYKLWLPLSRLTYCAYLVHPVIMNWYFPGLQQPIYYTHQTVVLYFFAFALLSYGIGFFVSLAFEAPMMKLEKLFRQRFTENEQKR